MGGVAMVARAISEDMQRRLPDQRKTQRRQLSEAVAALLASRTVNLMQVGAALPNRSDNRQSRNQWLKRVVSSPHIHANQLLAPYARELLATLHASGERIMLMLDQTTMTTSYRHEMAMLAVRFRNRALPLAWLVRKTDGLISIGAQLPLLDQVAQWLPEGAQPMLLADRFYGGKKLLGWCVEQGWGFRLRLRDRTEVATRCGDVMKVRQRFEAGQTALDDVLVTRERLPANVAMMQLPGHDEPLFIAMSDPASKQGVQDYAARWGIEAMFSDLKTRGFQLEDSRLKRADRLHQLMLLLALCLYWTVSTGLQAEATELPPAQKTCNTSARSQKPISNLLLHTRPPTHDHPYRKRNTTPTLTIHPSN